MKTDTSERQSVESFEIGKEIEISAPIDIAFAAMLDEIGPENQMLGGKPFPMKIEPWPGGRWYRDLGNGNVSAGLPEESTNTAGHLWGHQLDRIKDRAEQRAREQTESPTPLKPRKGQS